MVQGRLQMCCGQRTAFRKHSLDNVVPDETGGNSLSEKQRNTTHVTA